MNGKLERFGLGLVATLILFGAGNALIPGSPQPGSILADVFSNTPAAPYTVDVAIWPDSVELNPTDSLGNCLVEPCSVQFYAVSLLSDGTVLCSDATDSLRPGPWNAPGACYEAINLLDFTKLPQQDTTIVARNIRFTWQSQPDSIIGAYQQIDYHVMVKLAGTGQFQFDTVAVHPDTQFIWRDGAPNTAYEVAVYTRGLTADTALASNASQWVVFSYPAADTTIVDVSLPPPIVLPPVVVDTIAGDTIR